MIWLERRVCLWPLVGIMLWRWLRYRRGDCIWSGYGEIWCVYVGLWWVFLRRWCEGFVRGRECVSNRGVWGSLDWVCCSYGYGRCRWLALVRLSVCRVRILATTKMRMSMLCWWAVPMRTLLLICPLNSMGWLGVVDFNSCSGECVLCWSMRLMRHIFYLGLVILRIWMVACLWLFLTNWVGTLFEFIWGYVGYCVSGVA